MKFLVVVLALASLVQAEPEADPASLYRSFYGAPYRYNPYFTRPYYARSSYGYGLPGYSYTHVDRLHKRDADAQVFLNPAPVGFAHSALPFRALPFAYNTGVLAQPTAFAAPLFHSAPLPLAATPLLHSAPLPLAAAPVAQVATVNTIVPQHRPYTASDCVTAEGCAVKTLLEHGLVKREAESDADAEADPYFYATPASTFPLALNPYFNAPLAAPYNAPLAPYPSHLAPYGLNPYLNPYGAYSYGYPQPILAPSVVPAPAVVQAAPVAEVKAVPAEVLVNEAPVEIRTVPVAATPLVHTVPAVAPLPLVRQPIVKTFVEEVAKPVTYTHLGRTPIHPTTVLEKTSRVVAHTFH